MSNLMLVAEVGEKVEQVFINGDLKNLTSDERVRYYNVVCKSLGLNPMTKPFEYVTLNGKLTLYARKDATDQLRRIYSVSIDSVDTKQVGDLFLVTAVASIGGRKDSATGALNIANLKGEALANAIMKAETKAKRRVTLSICGLGFLDETEVEDAKEAIADEKIVAASKRFEESPQNSISESNQEGKEYFAVTVDYTDSEMRKKIKDMGFKWDAHGKAWISPSSGELAGELESMALDYQVVNR